MGSRDVHQAVERRYQGETSDVPLARELHGDAAAEAAADDRDVPVTGTQMVIQVDCVSYECSFGRLAAAATVATIVDEKE